MELREFKLSEIRSNPYRDLDEYPLQDKVLKSIESSIKSTNLWPQSVRINAKGKPEIPYGHHRLQAGINVLGKNHKQDFIVEEISDDDMLRRMADENAVVWSGRAGVMHAIQCVRVAKKRLEHLLKTDPATYCRMTGIDPANVGNGVGRDAICAYFGHGPMAGPGVVWKTLPLIEAIDELGIPMKQICRFPNLSQADAFCKTFKRFKLPASKAEEIIDGLYDDLTLIGGGTTPEGTGQSDRVLPEDRMTTKNIRSKLHQYALYGRWDKPVPRKSPDSLMHYLEALEKGLEMAKGAMSIMVREINNDPGDVKITGFNMKLFEDFDHHRENLEAVMGGKKLKLPSVISEIERKADERCNA